MPVHIGNNIINSSSLFIADGSSSDKAAKSGLDIKRLFPAKTSGYYWIQNDRMPNPLQMYVNLDSDCDGGGYDFYPITGGTAVSSTTEIHSGLVLGLDLIYPRSQGHWKAIYRFANNVLGDLAGYCQTCYAVSASVSTVAAGAYPTAFQNVARIGSVPGFSPLDIGTAGIASAASGNPAVMLSAATRPTLRYVAVSPMFQRNMLPSSQPQAPGLLNQITSNPLLNYGLGQMPQYDADRFLLPR